jgi:hypothetical protein
VLIIGVFLLTSDIHAQTWEEWTKQKKTQIKYLLEQIVAFRAYGKQLKEGYGIVQKGLSTIHSIKQGDFRLHEGFFSSLKSVNPNVRQYTKVAGIILLQSSIIKQGKKAIQTAQSSGQLNKDELQYLDQVFKGMLDQCGTLIDELTIVLTNDQMQRSDNERIGRIDALYVEMQEHYLFAQNFQQEITILAAQRISGQKDILQSRALYEIR